MSETIEYDPSDPRTKMGTREHAESITAGRHPGVRDALQWLTYSHLPPALRRYSAPFYAAAVDLITEIGTDSPELTTALNRLIESKDSAVRAGIKDTYGRAGSVPRPATVVDSPVFEVSTEMERDTDNITDGFHTFGELYDHRRALTAALAKSLSLDSWRSKKHHPDDSPMFEGGYFIVGINLPTGTITYHYKLSHWSDFDGVTELQHAPKWDGALPADTVTRLLEWAKG